MSFILCFRRSGLEALLRNAAFRSKHSNRYLREVINSKRNREQRLECAIDPPVPHSLKYEATVTPPFVLPHGWAPPPENYPTHLPFQIPRTRLGTALPVYSLYKNGRSKVMTVIRHVTGDIDDFSEEIKKVCNAETIERRGNTIQIKGNHVHNVRMWLYGLGF